MSQNLRKEPTFGEPSTLAESASTEQNLKNTQNASVSLHSSKAPSYTFTPVMKRPAEIAEFATMEEAQAVKKETVETAKIDVKPQAEPATGFAFSPVKEDEKLNTDKTDEAKTTSTERVIPNAVPPQVEKEKTASKVTGFSKFRRLGLVALLVLILIGIFFWLKPDAPKTLEEVEAIQSQSGNALPIEFRPVDEEEAKRAEAQARAEQEALAQAQAQQNQQTVAQESQPTEQIPATQPVQPSVEPATPQATEMAGQAEQPAQPVVAVKAAPAVKPATQPQASKPKTQGSVIHQAEKSEPKTVKIKAMTADEFNAKKAKNAEMDRFVKNVEAGKPVSKTKPDTTSPTIKTVEKPTVAKVAETTASASVASKTMTVPKATSLMQVFRDNNLNISDVNAMSKANNIVSNLKVGERVNVKLDKNNRVVEMSISSGGKFIRQADGSYRFTK